MSNWIHVYFFAIHHTLTIDNICRLCHKVKQEGFWWHTGKTESVNLKKINSKLWIREWIVATLSPLITKMTYTSHQIRVNIKSMNKDEHLKVCFDFFFILYMLYFRSRNNNPTLQITNLKSLIRNQISCK